MAGSAVERVVVRRAPERVVALQPVEDGPPRSRRGEVVRTVRATDAPARAPGGQVDALEADHGRRHRVVDVEDEAAGGHVPGCGRRQPRRVDDLRVDVDEVVVAPAAVDHLGNTRYVGQLGEQLVAPGSAVHPVGRGPEIVDDVATRTPAEYVLAAARADLVVPGAAVGDVGASAPGRRVGDDPVVPAVAEDAVRAAAAEEQVARRTALDHVGMVRADDRCPAGDEGVAALAGGHAGPRVDVHAAGRGRPRDAVGDHVDRRPRVPAGHQPIVAPVAGEDVAVPLRRPLVGDAQEVPAAEQVVVAAVAAQPVTAGASADPVVASATVDGVVAAEPDDDVGTLRAVDHVVAVGPDDGGGAPVARWSRCAGRGAPGPGGHQRERGGTDDESSHCRSPLVSWASLRVRVCGPSGSEVPRVTDEGRPEPPRPAPGHARPRSLLRTVVGWSPETGTSRSSSAHPQCR